MDKFNSLASIPSERSSKVSEFVDEPESSIQLQSLLTCKKCPFSQEIQDLKLIEACFWKQYFLVPFLSVITLFLFPLILYWYPDLYIKFYFGKTFGVEDLKNPETSIEKLVERIRALEITHVVIEDSSKRKHVIPLKVKQQTVLFKFRYIWFQYHEHQQLSGGTGETKQKDLEAG